MATKNIFVIGLDEFNRSHLERIRGASQYRFHGLLPLETAVHAENYDVDALLAEARSELEGFAGSVDAIVSYWDFPSSAMVPILRQWMGLPSPSLESVLMCEHKYWSRVEQTRAVPEHVPAFAAFNPFDADPLAQIDLPYPFWIKPVKAHSSQLGFHIAGRADFEAALPVIRDGIGRLATPFDTVLRYADVPAEIAPIGGHYCLAEAIISEGLQCTLEGYVQNGRTHVYGVVDSLRKGKYGSCFTRYVYPSDLPSDVTDRMKAITGRFFEHIGFDQATFNIEFFYDSDRDEIKLLEINPRISKSHSPLFELVDGASHQQVMVEVALGKDPGFPEREGRYPMAAKFMTRVYQDARVVAVPSEADIAAAHSSVPGTEIELGVEAGQHLSELLHQDPYSYEVAVIFIGGEREADLEDKYRRCIGMLPFEFDPPIEDDLYLA
ncbi:ATP-grasp domain-containing protein [Ectothiorhodospiraceae bacterium WFHF3C12]|nr:ATP-grasp domain-containing protein [Ectothiorhodospiraceae bacterium WFHF3C12]